MRWREEQTRFRGAKAGVATSWRRPRVRRGELWRKHQARLAGREPRHERVAVRVEDDRDGEPVRTHERGGLGRRRTTIGGDETHPCDLARSDLARSGRLAPAIARGQRALRN